MFEKGYPTSYVFAGTFWGRRPEAIAPRIAAPLRMAR